MTAPTDPAGLDAEIQSAMRLCWPDLPPPRSDDNRHAAIEAARAAYDSVAIAHGAWGHRSGHHEGTVAAVRAAAPHIRRAALLEAADDLAAMAREPDVPAAHAMAYGHAAHRLRERAERETT